ncbi:MAG: hypothetical protein ACRKGH_05765 [Dehalogenimonas sp.]
MLDIVFAPMALTPTTFNAGDTVRVTVSFKYVVGVTKTVKLLAGPYSTNLFGKHMVNSCVGQADVTLPASSTPTEGTGSVDFLLVPKSSGGIDDGTFGLRVWIEETNAVAEQDAVIIVTGNSSGGDMLSGITPMIMMLLMMGMIVPMTQNLGEDSG